MRLALVLLLAIVGAAFAAEPLVKITKQEPVYDFQVNEAKDKLSFTAYGHVWTFNIWTSDVYTGSQDHFHGRLTSDSKSFASFTLLPSGYTTGMIILANETYWVEAPLQAEDKQLYIYKSSDVWAHPSIRELKCSNTHAHSAHHHKGHHNPIVTRSTITATIYKDQDWSNSGNNPWAGDAETYGLLNDVIAVYINAGLSPYSFNIAGQRTNNGFTDTNSMLNDFSTWVQNSGTAIPSSNVVAWLVGQNVGGLAWVGTACGGSTRYYTTGVCGLSNFSRLWTVKTIAHELGHSRGANHDFTNQCADGQSSGCQCSVMSYCFPTDSTFGGAVNYFSATSIGEITSTCN